MHWQRWLTWGIVAAAVAFSAYLVVPALMGSASAPATVGLQVGDVPPNFTLPTVTGHRVSLAALSGRAVWINFWATWCPWCRREMPFMQRIAMRYRSRLVVLGVDVQQPAAVVRPFLERHDITYPVALDLSGQVATAYDVSGLPVSVFVAPDGRITAYFPGSLLSERTMMHLVRQALAGTT
jgi:cytochrome c biogenesis protein CcmG/thiol:disulfide interchange protein DsbE